MKKLTIILTLLAMVACNSPRKISGMDLKGHKKMYHTDKGYLYRWQVRNIKRLNRVEQPKANALW